METCAFTCDKPARYSVTRQERSTRTLCHRHTVLERLLCAQDGEPMPTVAPLTLTPQES